MMASCALKKTRLAAGWMEGHPMCPCFQRALQEATSSMKVSF